MITEAELKKNLLHGFFVEVVATKDAEKVNSFWRGNWFVRQVSADRSRERILASVKQTLIGGSKRKDFKTANGLISFLQRMGFSSSGIPHIEGGIEIHALANLSQPDVPVSE